MGQALRSIRSYTKPLYEPLQGLKDKKGKIKDKSRWIDLRGYAEDIQQVRTKIRDDRPSAYISQFQVADYDTLK